MYDIGLIHTLAGTALLNLMKDSLTLIALLFVMFYQNWKLALFSLLVMPLAAIIAKSLGKRMGKATTKSAESSGNFSTLFSEILKGSKIIKIYQRENFEQNRAEHAIDDLTEKEIKIGKILIRATPLMEVLLGITIGLFIYFCGFLIASGEIGVNNFFSFLAAMMLAYQPVRSLATLNVVIQQGLSGARKVLPIIDEIPEIREKPNSFELSISNGEIDFRNVRFNYSKN